MLKVICIDDTEGESISFPKLLTNGKVYDAYTSEDFEGLHPLTPGSTFIQYQSSHMGKYTPKDCYYIIGDDGYPIMPLRIHFIDIADYRDEKISQIIQ
jgi:hypothetical protein